MPEKRLTLWPRINFVFLLAYFISTWTCVGYCIKVFYIYICILAEQQSVGR